MHRLILVIISAQFFSLGTCKSIDRVTALWKIKKEQPYIINNSTVGAFSLNATTDIFRNCSDEDVALSFLPYLEEHKTVSLKETLHSCGEDCVGLLEWSPCKNVKVNTPPFASNMAISILQKNVALPGRKVSQKEFLYIAKGVLQVRLVTSQPRFGLNLFNTGVFLYEDKVYTNTMLYLPKNSYVQFRAEQQGTIFYTLTDEQQIEVEGNIDTAW